jgi:hypothetical protein
VEGLQSSKPALGLRGDALKVVLADKTFRQSVQDEIAADHLPPLQRPERWDKVHVVRNISTCA